MSQGAALVEGNMIGLVALDLVLWIIRARVMEITFVVHVPGVHANNMAADLASFGIPAHVIARFESQWSDPGARRVFRAEGMRHQRSDPASRPHIWRLVKHPHDCFVPDSFHLLDSVRASLTACGGLIGFAHEWPAGSA
jgi:hypothetical protein